MKRSSKIFIVGLLLIGTIYLILDSIGRSIVSDKPEGQCVIQFSRSIEESKQNGQWKATYKSDRYIFHSVREDDSLVIGIPFIERDWSCNSGLILVIPIIYSSENNLHRIKRDYLDQTAHVLKDQKNNGVTFEMDNSPDTIELYIHERNPNDSLAWMTHTVIDTIVLVKN